MRDNLPAAYCPTTLAGVPFSCSKVTQTVHSLQCSRRTPIARISPRSSSCTSSRGDTPLQITAPPLLIVGVEFDNVDLAGLEMQESPTVRLNEQAR